MPPKYRLKGKLAREGMAASDGVRRRRWVGIGYGGGSVGTYVIVGMRFRIEAVLRPRRPRTPRFAGSRVLVPPFGQLLDRDGIQRGPKLQLSGVQGVVGGGICRSGQQAAWVVVIIADGKELG